MASCGRTLPRVRKKRRITPGNSSFVRLCIGASMKGRNGDTNGVSHCRLPFHAPLLSFVSFVHNRTGAKTMPMVACRRLQTQCWCSWWHSCVTTPATTSNMAAPRPPVLLPMPLLALRRVQSSAGTTTATRSPSLRSSPLQCPKWYRFHKGNHVVTSCKSGCNDFNSYMLVLL